MIYREIPIMGETILVSPLSLSSYMIKKHLENGAKLIYLHKPDDNVVFDSGASDLVKRLLDMRQLLEDNDIESQMIQAQCVLLYEYDNRRVLLDTISLWTNWGGVALPVIHSLDYTLKSIEEQLLDGMRGYDYEKEKNDD